MLKLLFIRHGESRCNAEKRMAGHLADPLTPTGQHQCQRLAHYLYHHQWRPTHIYTSPLQRAIASLGYLLAPWTWALPPDLLPSSEHRVSPTNGPVPSPEQSPAIFAVEELKEFQAGILTGLTWAEARVRYPALCHTLETSQDWVAIPQAETPLQGRERARQFIERLLDHHQESAAVWIVSHHWIMEHLIACLMGCDRTWQLSIPNTALFEFWLDRDRWHQSGMASGISDLWQVKRFGERPHLNMNCPGIDEIKWATLPEGNPPDKAF